MTLPYDPWPGGVPRKGTWHAYGEIVMAACPRCGRVAGLGGHSVSEGGVVSPSVVCPREGCGFHEDVVLEGWGKDA